MAYNKDTDYQALINQAVQNGNYKAAAQYEQQRNEKINDLNSSGTNKYNAEATNKYSGWLDTTDYSTIGQQQMASGAHWTEVKDTYDKRLDKAAGTVGMEQYVNDDKQKAMLDYILAGQQGEQLPTFSYNMGSKPTYTSQYESRIDAMLNQILNREDFSYNAENDPLYQQYRTQYIREGNRAMNDTLAAAAANAGGMNSHAITAAQQAYNYYASQPGDKIPELYQLAYEMYLTDIDNQVRDLGLLNDMDDRQYSRYRDTMSDWYNDRDFAYNQYRDQMGDYQWDTTFDYGVSRDKINDAWREKEFDYNASINDRDFNYTLDRDKIEDAWRNEEWQHQLEQDALAADQWQQSFDYEKYLNAQKLANSGGGGSGGSGGSGGGSGGGSKKDEKDDNGYDPDEPAEATPSFSDYSDAAEYLSRKGVPGTDIGGMMTMSEWSRRKSSFENFGQGGVEVTGYDSYGDYLNAFVQYLLEKNGK